MTPGGLPHSGIDGSPPADNSPSLIAAIHALLRLVAPRHPPCALSRSAPRVAPCQANRIDLNQLLPHQTPAYRQAELACCCLTGITHSALVKVHEPCPDLLWWLPTRCRHLAPRRPVSSRLLASDHPRSALLTSARADRPNRPIPATAFSVYLSPPPSTQRGTTKNRPDPQVGTTPTVTGRLPDRYRHS